MMEVNDMHGRAMILANEAVAARMRGDEDEERRLLSLAFEAERDAALLLVGSFGVEPTRSVLFRSAAALALDVERFDEAEQMANLGLGGGPPEPIRTELQEIVEEVGVQRHLALKGIELLSNEFQVAIWEGSDVGAGFISSREMIDRVRRLEQIISREAVRRRGLPFDPNSTLPKDLKDNFQTFISAPRNGSFAFTVRVGVAPQLNLFPGESNADLVTEVTRVINAITENDEATLESLVPEDLYRRNYIAQVRHLAPDGVRIKEVGITASGGGEPYSVRLAVRPAVMSVPSVPPVHSGEELDQPVQLRGELRTASGHKGSQVGILVPGNTRLTILAVPVEILNDIVRPYFGQNVIVTAVKTKTGLRLTEVWPDED